MQKSNISYKVSHRACMYSTRNWLGHSFLFHQVLLCIRSNKKHARFMGIVHTKLLLPKRQRSHGSMTGQIRWQMTSLPFSFQNKRRETVFPIYIHSMVAALCSPNLFQLVMYVCYHMYLSAFDFDFPSHQLCTYHTSITLRVPVPVAVTLLLFIVRDQELELCQ